MINPISSTKPVARKKHFCSWCNEDILFGEQYSRWKGLFEGEFQSNAMHLECNDAVNRCPREEMNDFGYPEGEQLRGKTFKEQEEMRHKP